eukprot:2465899-Lingulodinium_polyedra.AAC.1
MAQLCVQPCMRACMRVRIRACVRACVHARLGPAKRETRRTRVEPGWEVWPAQSGAASRTGGGG